MINIKEAFEGILYKNWPLIEVTNINGIFQAKRKREETERAIHENISKQALKKHDGGSGSGGGGLNRSYSSPNIKKMLDEDEDQGFGEAKVPIPNFDRGSKPAVSDKSRNFAAVWGTSKKGVC